MREKNYGFKEFKCLIKKFIEDKVIFSIGILSRIVSTFLSLYLTYRIKDFIDGFSQMLNRNNLLMELFIFFIFQIILVVISTYIMEIVGIQVVTNLKKSLFSKILYLDKKSLDNNISERKSLKLIDDTDLIYKVISKHLSQTIGAIVSVIISLVVLFSIDFRLTIITLGILLLCILLIYPLSKRKSLLHKQMDKEAEKLNKF
ncbi:MAG: ABC transporter ATP-binding protein, partial [Tissierellia bacterium]|nr:ABC transporter ATP-binding protein [Tissierellia bacterium]